jgi:hypothetical protein
MVRVGVSGSNLGTMIMDTIRWNRDLFCSVKLENDPTLFHLESGYKFVVN